MDNNNTGLDLSLYACVGSDGLPNKDETIKKFTSDFEKYLHAQLELSETILNAVNQVFDENKHKRLYMDAIVCAAMSKFDYDIEKSSSIQSMIRSIIMSNEYCFLTSYSGENDKNPYVCRILND
jgi:hypothetical protein